MAHLLHRLYTQGFLKYLGLILQYLLARHAWPSLSQPGAQAPVAAAHVDKHDVRWSSIATQLGLEVKNIEPGRKTGKLRLHEAVEGGLVGRMRSEPRVEVLVSMLPQLEGSQ